MPTPRRPVLPALLPLGLSLTLVVLAALAGPPQAPAQAPKAAAPAAGGPNRQGAPGGSGAAPKGAPAGAPRAVAITVGRAEARAVQRTIETTGSLVAWDEVQVRAEISGTLVRLAADLGDVVAEGAVLAEYDRRELELVAAQARAGLAGARALLARARQAQAALEAEVARTRSQAELANAELARGQELHRRELIARRDVDAAENAARAAAAGVSGASTALDQHPAQVAALEADVALREAQLALADKRLRDTAVRAPVGGRVARRHVAAGEFVRDGAPLFTLVVANPLKYAGTVPERHAPELRAGLAVRLAVEAFPGRAFTGAVHRIAPAVDPATRTLGFEARVANANGALTPGSFARGEVLTRRDVGAVFVPVEAVASLAGVTKVFVIADGRAAERRVRPGSRQGAWVEIPDGVRPGDVVATSNVGALYQGAAVTLVPAR